MSSSEATGISLCSIAQQVLKKHESHPQYFRIGLPGIQVRSAPVPQSLHAAAACTVTSKEGISLSSLGTS